LEDKDGVPSLIRLVDTVNMPKPKPSAWPEGEEGPLLIAIPLTAFLAFKSGDAKGEHTVGLLIVTPSGKRQKSTELKIELLGDEHGVNVRIPVAAPLGEDGLCWYHVLLDGKSVTRMPLRIVHTNPATQEQPARSRKGET
jgi:hypothetical protein